MSQSGYCYSLGVYGNGMMHPLIDLASGNCSNISYGGLLGALSDEDYGRSEGEDYSVVRNHFPLFEALLRSGVASSAAFMDSILFLFFAVRQEALNKAKIVAEILLSYHRSVGNPAIRNGLLVYVEVDGASDGYVLRGSRLVPRELDGRDLPSGGSSTFLTGNSLPDRPQRSQRRGYY